MSTPYYQLQCLPIDQLSPEVRAFWCEMQRKTDLLESPLFRPEYVEKVSAVRADVEVGVIDGADGVLGVFAFQRDEQNVATPVGGPFADYHGLIAPAELDFEPQTLLKQCGLNAWLFRRMPQLHDVMQPYAWAWMPAESAQIDLAQGFGAYRRARKKAHCEQLEQILRKGRKMNREIGELRFFTQQSEARVFEQLIDWKIREYRRLGVRNQLGPAWAVNLIQALTEAEGEHFSGRLCALYAGERLAAVNLCLTSGGVWHSLLSAENEQLARYSPGLVLISELAQFAESLGVRKIDVGQSSELYKSGLSSGSVILSAGAVDLRLWPGFIGRSFSRTQAAVRSMPLGGQAQQLVRTARAWLLQG